MKFLDYIKIHKMTVESLAKSAHVRAEILMEYACGRKRWADAPKWLSDSVAYVLDIDGDDLMDFDEI